MKDFFDVRGPFFEPIWRRYVAFGVVAGWALIEASRGAFIWAAIFGAAAAYLGWVFFIAWDEK